MSDSTEYLFESPDERLQWGPNGPERVRLQSEIGPLERSNFLNRQGLAGTRPNPNSFNALSSAFGEGAVRGGTQGAQGQQAPRQLTPDELMAQAKMAIDAAAAQKEAQLSTQTLGERDAFGNRLPDWLVKSVRGEDK